MIDYRTIAREALDRAKRELADVGRVRYAVLEIRDALEAVTYERALFYKDEIPETVSNIWTPKEVLAFLIEMDPSAELAGSIALADRGTTGQNMAASSAETIFTQADLKTAYDVLESHLHVATATPILPAGSGDLRSWCQSCIEILDQILLSDLWGIKSGVFATTTCIRCKNAITKRLDPASTETLVARCIHCGASYSVKLEKTKTIWEPDIASFRCETPSCNVVFGFLPDEIALGKEWTCPKCNSRWQFCLAIGKVESLEEGSSKAADIGSNDER